MYNKQINKCNANLGGNELKCNEKNVIIKKPLKTGLFSLCKTQKYIFCIYTSNLFWG